MRSGNGGDEGGGGGTEVIHWDKAGGPIEVELAEEDDHSMYKQGNVRTKR